MLRRLKVVRSGQTLYHYAMRKLIGAGGFGEVFKARILELDTLVALKRFRAARGDTEKVYEDWLKEYGIHSALTHPSILQVLDAFVSGSHFYIATELATCSMDRFINAGEAWTDEVVVAAGIQVSSALHYIHETRDEEHPIVHRDVTPKNVFYFEDKDLFKLGDFGISKVLPSKEDVAVTEVANWGFVSPELVRQHFTSEQSDLYQLGLVLLSMCTGRYPVDQSLSAREKAQAIAEGLPWKVADSLTGVHPALKRVIKKLLFRDLAKRFESAEEVYDALRAVARTLPE
jgi:serine/threonine protein kinase